MTYIIIGIVLGIIISILEIKFKLNKEAIWIGILLGLIVFGIAYCIENNEQENYIQNIEEKLNIYEQDYINFATEDSKKQIKGE